MGGGQLILCPLVVLYMIFVTTYLCVPTNFMQPFLLGYKKKRISKKHACRDLCAVIGPHTKEKEDNVPVGSGKNPFSCPFFIFWAYICFGRTSSCNINFSVQMQMITTDMYGKTVQKAFDFLDAEYNMVIHVFLQKLVLSA